MEAQDDLCNVGISGFFTMPGNGRRMVSAHPPQTSPRALPFSSQPAHRPTQRPSCRIHLLLKETIERPFVLVPPAYQLWAHVMQLPQPPHRYSPACPPKQAASSRTLSISIRSPTDGARYILNETIPSDYSTLSLEVDISKPIDSVIWYANGHEIESWPYRMRWPLRRGQFRIFATTPDGRFRSPPVIVSVR